MMKALLKKEFALCAHPTSYFFLCFAAFVFIPDYPYEVMFYFSGLSVFFVCITARENGDAPFTCTLPVRKGDAARARILMCALLQGALFLLCALFAALKQLAFPAAMQVNMAGMMANTALLSGGALLLGLFNIVFFPHYFLNVRRVGIPFLFAAIAQFAVIILFVVMRHALPFVRDVLNTPDPTHMGAKLALLAAGLAFYALCLFVSLHLSAKRFCAADL